MVLMGPVSFLEGSWLKLNVYKVFVTLNFKDFLQVD